MKIYLGTWQTAPSDGFWTGQNISESEKTLSYGVRSGISGFDCAQSYGHGQAEQTLGKVLRRFPSQSLLVDTKIMPTTKEPKVLVAQSVKRLGCSIDCLYLHWPKTGFNHRAFLQKMLELKKEGLVKKVGVCNLPLEDLKTLLSSGLQLDRIQRPLSLLWSRDYAQCANFCRENGLELAVYSPSGMGLLSGKYRVTSDLNDARKDLFCFRPECREQYLALLDLISSIALAHNVSNTAVALSWTREQKPDILILGARSQRQLEENMNTDLKLSEEELSTLSEASKTLSEAARETPNIFSYNW